MRTLSPMHSVHEVDVLGITALRMLGDAGHGITSVAPDVSLIDIVVVRQTNRRPVAHQITKGPAAQIPLPEIVQHGRFHGAADDPETTHTL